ncbi:restriction endonuclease subunit S [Tritonibacter sp. SIMBA_163]|uniref:restriction endonuclease subunit S n=1 Tax=Tritonibacter sp. SIMBA_163 TaxID=3080868 RepID=UPI003980FD12
MTELPSSWTTCPIGEVLVSVEMTAKDEPDREIWYVDISSIDNQSNKVVDPKRMALSSAPSRARQKIIAGDTLFSTVRPYLRKIAAVPEKYDGEIASTGFAVLRPAEGIHHRYIFYKSVSHDFVSALTGEQYGVSYPAVKEEQVRSQELQLPPTNEQRRIVERIEAMFDEIDHGVENLKKARATLGLYRQSLLKSAFEGRLTADWRARNADKLETPETLLARIRSERDTRYKSALDDWQKALTDWRENGEEGKKPSKPRLPSEIDKISASELAELEEIPENWLWARLGDLLWLSSQNGVYKPASDYGSGTSIVRIDDFYDGELIRLSGFKRLKLSVEEQKQYQVEVGDLLVNRVNSLDYLGKCAPVPPLSEVVVYESNIMKCHPISTGTSADWIARYLSSQRGRDRIRKHAKHAVNQASINQTDVGLTIVSICSPQEQAEITRILDERLSAADALEAEIDAGLTRAEALRQSILKQAFSGKLVPQDTEDEPAADLLARIRVEKATKPKKRRATDA